MLAAMMQVIIPIPIQAEATSSVAPPFSVALGLGIFLVSFILFALFLAFSILLDIFNWDDIGDVFLKIAVACVAFGMAGGIIAGLLAAIFGWGTP